MKTTDTHRIKNSDLFTNLETPPAPARNHSKELFNQITEALDTPPAEKPAAATAEKVKRIRTPEVAREDTDAAARKAKRIKNWATLIFLCLLFITSSFLTVRWIKSVMAVKAAQQQKLDAFLNAGWRQSETIQSGPGIGENRESPYVLSSTAYIKDLSPDDGRVYMLVKEFNNEIKNYQIEGWTRTEEQRDQALYEITSTFTISPPSTHIELRPQGGSLLENEIRFVEPRQEYYSSEGQKINRIEYGESGYALVEKDALEKDGEEEKRVIKISNLVSGKFLNAPYYFVIGGGGSYWQTPQQRQTIIDKAFERLKKAPDGGKNAQAIRLIYYYRDTNPYIEDINIIPKKH